MTIFKFQHPALVVASILSLLYFGTPSSYANDLTLSKMQQASLGIESVSLVKVNDFLSPSYPAQAVIPLSQVNLVTTPLSGLITKIYHVHGPIKKGEVIAELLSSDLLTEQKNYLNTLSDLNTAQTSLARALKLTQNGVISIKNKQQAQANVRKLSQIKRQQKENLALMGMAEPTIKKLEKSQKQQTATIQIKADQSGELFDLQVKVGQRLLANQPIISIGQIHPIVVDVRLPVNDVKEIKEGQKVQLTGYNKIGQVAHISSFADPMTQTVEIHTRFENDNNAIRPGQLLHLNFVQPSAPNDSIYQAPSSAISNFKGQDVVYLMDSDKIIVQPIQIIGLQAMTLVFKTVKPIAQNFRIIVKSTTAIKAALLEASGEE